MARCKYMLVVHMIHYIIWFYILYFFCQSTQTRFFRNWEATTNVTLQSEAGRCATIRGVDGKWQAHDCTEPHPYICEKEARTADAWRDETRAQHMPGLPVPLHVFPLRQDSRGIDVIGNGSYAQLNAVRWTADDHSSAPAATSLIDVSESNVNISVESTLGELTDFSLSLNFRVFSFDDVSLISYHEGGGTYTSFALSVTSSGSQPWLIVTVQSEEFGTAVNLTAGWCVPCKQVFASVS